jgi:hypothetical protein
MDWARILAYVTGMVDQELLGCCADPRPDFGCAAIEPLFRGFDILY